MLYSLIILLVFLPTLLVALQADEVPEWMLAVSCLADIGTVTTGIRFGGGAVLKEQGQVWKVAVWHAMCPFRTWWLALGG